MKFELEDKRKAVIAEPGNVLVMGGPGAGKTTLAILKAQQRMPSFKPGQTALFLSFSRAAVQQILLRCRSVLSRDEMQQIEVRTYHSFCWELLKYHGRALGGVPLKMVTPGQEGVMRTQFAGDWAPERHRLLNDEARISFEVFAHAAARLVEESKHIRAGIADAHPLMILDEFQDTDDDQWRLVNALSGATKSVFLADPEQRIYGYRSGVRADRLDILRKTIGLKETDLEADNFRSPASDVLRYANAIVAGKAPERCKDVTVHTYKPFLNMFNSTVHFHVGQMLADLRKRGIADPSVAVLAASNDLVATISEVLSGNRNFGRVALKPIAHDTAWDAELSAASALAVAALLEQASAYSENARIASLHRVRDYWLLKKDWYEQNGREGAKTANDRANRFGGAAALLRAGKAIRAGGPQLIANFNPDLSGDPVADWRCARGLCAGHDDLKDIASQARMVRLSQMRDPLAMALGSIWSESATYIGAVRTVSAVLDQQRLIGSDQTPRGCVLMTLHKSKGKEFDGVVIVEGYHTGFLMKADEAPGYESSRRVLRVGITRARHAVRIIRPDGAIAFFN